MKQTVIYEVGNIWHIPGEIITVFGTGFDAVTEIELYQVPDSKTITDASFLPTVRYDAICDSAEYIALAVPSYKGTKYGFDLLQRSDDTLQFRLPENGANGIWALALLGENGEKLVKYINVPRINFCQGDEGGSMTAGAYLLVTGSNICPSGNADDVTLFMKNDKQSFVLKATECDSAFAANFIIPEYAGTGVYEISLHNGFGDASCCSVPVRVCVAESYKTKRPAEVFNVKDFGALGKGSLHNDTPNFLAAIGAAKENGGGTVLVPKGIYALLMPLVLPENVYLKGEGIIKSKIIWIPFNWDEFDLPEAMITLNNNTEVSGIDFSGTRVGSMFWAQSGKKLQNIHIHDCRIFFTPTNGGPTQASPVGTDADLDVLHNVISQESSIYTIKKAGAGFKMRNVDNLRIHNIDYYAPYAPVWLGGCNNVYLADSTFVGQGRTNGTFNFHCNNAVIKNVTVNGNCASISGDNIYHSGCRHMNVIINNREVMTTDGAGSYPGPSVEYVAPTVYKLPYTYTQNSIVGEQLLIQNGTGKGQMRRVVANEGNLVYLDSPFAVLPDKDSFCSVQSARSNLIAVKNYFYNSGDYQYYGTQLNTVFADNELEKMRGIAFVCQPLYGHVQPEWYITIANNLLWDANFLHHVGYNNGLKPFSKIQIGASGSKPDILMCFELIGNELRDGYFVTVNNGLGAIRLMHGITIQKNKISDAEYGFLLGMNPNASEIIFDGNAFDEVEKPYVLSEEYSALYTEKKLDHVMINDPMEL